MAEKGIEFSKEQREFVNKITYANPIDATVYLARHERNITIDFTAIAADKVFYLPEVEEMAGLMISIHMIDRASNQVTLTQNTDDIISPNIIASTLVSSLVLDLSHEYYVLLSIGHYWVRIGHKSA